MESHLFSMIVLLSCLQFLLTQTRAQPCPGSCNPPECSCPRFDYPMDTHEIPQMVYFGFDDAVNVVMSSLYQRIFTTKRVNPNGCRMPMTLYVSHQYTDYKKVKQFYDEGNEIAVHSVTHSNIDDDEILRKEAKQQKENLVKAGVPEQEIIGWRSPFLKTAGNNQPKILKELGYEYDISLTYSRPTMSVPKPWPFTINNGWPYRCGIRPCPTQARVDRFWEVPVVSMMDHKNSYPCSYVDGCAVRANNENEAFKFLMTNFHSYYNTTRAPFGLNMHAAWFYTRYNLKAMIRFLDELMNYKDVYVVTVKQMLDWMKKPTPMSEITNMKTWQCKESQRALEAKQATSKKKPGLSTTTTTTTQSTTTTTTTAKPTTTKPTTTTKTPIRKRPNKVRRRPTSTQRKPPADKRQRPVLSKKKSKSVKRKPSSKRQTTRKPTTKKPTTTTTTSTTTTTKPTTTTEIPTTTTERPTTTTIRTTMTTSTKSPTKTTTTTTTPASVQITPQWKPIIDSPRLDEALRRKLPKAPTPTRSSKTSANTSGKRPWWDFWKTLTEAATTFSKKCIQNINCKLPDCYCQGSNIPNNITASDVPQMVYITIDGDVNPSVYRRYRQLFREVSNPNGCPARGTVFVSDEGTYSFVLRRMEQVGAEIAMQGLNERHFGNAQTMEQEMKHQKNTLSKYGINKVHGWKTPELKALGNDQFRLLKEYGFKYDSTLVNNLPKLGENHPWPFTLDYGYKGSCVIPTCPTKSFPGLWEISGTPLLDYMKLYECFYVDGCMYNPPFANTTFSFLLENFNTHYKYNRSPFGIHLRQAWFTHPAYVPNIRGLLYFVAYLRKLSDVYLVSASDVITWMQNPTPLGEITKQRPWKC